MSSKTKKSCMWPGSNELLMEYHDEEWGHPKHSDTQHFEFLILEAAQASFDKTPKQKGCGCLFTIYNKKKNKESACAIYF